MNLGLLYYFLVALGNFKWAVNFGTFITSVLAALFAVIYLISRVEVTSGDKSYERVEIILRKYLKISVVLLSIFSFLNFITPNKRDSLIITGLMISSSTIKDAASGVMDTFPKLKEVVDLEIDKYLEEEKMEENKR